GSGFEPTTVSAVTKGHPLVRRAGAASSPGAFFLDRSIRVVLPRETNLAPPLKCIARYPSPLKAAGGDASSRSAFSRAAVRATRHSSVPSAPESSSMPGLADVKLRHALNP